MTTEKLKAGTPVADYEIDRDALLAKRGESAVKIWDESSESKRRILAVMFPYGAFLHNRACSEIADTLTTLLQSTAKERDAENLRSRQWCESQLIEWLDTPKSERKPANIAFTAGHERQVAYRFERIAESAREAERTRIRKVIELMFVPAVDGGENDLAYNNALRAVIVAAAIAAEQDAGELK